MQRIVTLNPHFIALYEFGGLVVLKETSDIKDASKLLHYGWEKNPEPWEFPYHLGYVELFYNGNNKQALKWLSTAMVLPACPPFFRGLYYSLLSKQKDAGFYIDYLNGLYLSTQNKT